MKFEYYSMTLVAVKGKGSKIYNVESIERAFNILKLTEWAANPPGVCPVV